jgi:hypothetical protein
MVGKLMGLQYKSLTSIKAHQIGPMYLLAGDTPEAIKAFAWYKNHFPDDIGDPFHLNEHTLSSECLKLNWCASYLILRRNIG